MLYIIQMNSRQNMNSNTRQGIWPNQSIFHNCAKGYSWLLEQNDHPLVAVKIFSLSPNFYSRVVLSLLRRVLKYRDVEVGASSKAACRKLFTYPKYCLECVVFGHFVSSKTYDISLSSRQVWESVEWWHLHRQSSIDCSLFQ